MLLEEELTRQAIGAFYAVYNRLGYGFLENLYVAAMVIELERLGLKVVREAPIPATYDGILLGNYRADLLVNDRLIIEVKAASGASGVHERQLRNYLRCSDLEVGLLLVFGIKPEFRRVVHSQAFKNGIGQ